MVPIYAAEMSPKEIRGKLGSFFQLFFAAGVFVSYWVDYGVQTNQPSISRQWQIPIGLQLVPGGLVGLGMLLIKESTRWLAKRGRNDEALESLIWVRGGEETSEVTAEFAEIVQGIENEIRATEGVTMRELWLPANRYRLGIAISLQLCQQLTGNTSLAYVSLTDGHHVIINPFVLLKLLQYAPQIFKAVGAGNANLLITGFFGLVKLVSVFTFVVSNPSLTSLRQSFSRRGFTHIHGSPGPHYRPHRP